jgi:organic hydroperoxide reductase OsmC/OhrA
MMVQCVVDLRNVPGTEAALGWASGHTVVVDRPADTAGGMGLGFNGGQLLALALGGCYCNDLRYAAHELGREIGSIEVTVKLELAGTPLIVIDARLSVSCEMADGSDATDLIERAWANCTVANSLNKGIRTTIESRS